MARLKYAVLIVAVLFVISFAGFIVLEGLTPLDSAYLTVATLATVGYGDVHPQTAAGKIFSMLIILLGVGAVYYTFVLAVSMVVEGKMSDFWGKHTMKKQIANLQQHIIVCGGGRVGENVIQRLQHEKEAFVVIERDPAIYEHLALQRILAINGDATLDEVLIEAGIATAKGIITALPHDADNVYVTLTSKSLNPNIVIVSRADRQEAEEKLRRAGATTVIFPLMTGGRQMVTALTKPAIMDFVENVFYNQELHLDIAEFRVNEQSPLVGQSLLTSQIKERYDAIVVAIKRETQLLSNPKADEVLCGGDVLIVLGRRDLLNRLNEIASGTTLQ